MIPTPPPGGGMRTRACVLYRTRGFSVNFLKHGGGGGKRRWLCYFMSIRWPTKVRSHLKNLSIWGEGSHSIWKGDTDDNSCCCPLPLWSFCGIECNAFWRTSFPNQLSCSPLFCLLSTENPHAICVWWLMSKLHMSQLFATILIEWELSSSRGRGWGLKGAKPSLHKAKIKIWAQRPKLL